MYVHIILVYCIPNTLMIYNHICVFLQGNGSTTVIKSFAKARVQTTSSGKADMTLHANVPMSQASCSVTINVASGKAQAEVRAQEPTRKKLQVRRSAAAPKLLLKGPSEAD